MRITTLALSALAICTLAGCDSNSPDGLSGRYEGTITAAAATRLGVDLPAGRGGDTTVDAALILDRTSGDNYDALIEVVIGTEDNVEALYRINADATYDEPDFELEFDADLGIGPVFEGEVSDDGDTIELEDAAGNAFEVSRVSDED